MDRLTKEQRRKNMQAVNSKGSEIEIKFAKALWKLGYRYRKNDKKVFCKPDLTLKKYHLAIFVDSEFWHGKDWKNRKYDHKTNKKFWFKKIEGNIKRDKLVNRKLSKDGWTVIRIWGKEIKENLEKCFLKIERKVYEV